MLPRVLSWRGQTPSASLRPFFPGLFILSRFFGTGLAYPLGGHAQPMTLGIAEPSQAGYRRSFGDDRARGQNSGLAPTAFDEDKEHQAICTSYMNFISVSGHLLTAPLLEINELAI